MSFVEPVFVLSILALVGLLLWAAYSDVKSFTIPNSLTLAVLLLYIPFVLSSGGTVDWTAGLIVAAIVLVVGFVLFAFGTVGGGDIKLLAAVSAWAGPAYIFDFLITTGLVGGVLALIMLGSVRFGFALALEKVGFRVGSKVLQGTVLPYGLAIASGGLVVAWRLAEPVLS